MKIVKAWDDPYYTTHASKHLTVYEQEPYQTVVYNQYGEPLARPKNKIGFRLE